MSFTVFWTWFFTLMTKWHNWKWDTLNWDHADFRCHGILNPIHDQAINDVKCKNEAKITKILNDCEPLDYSINLANVMISHAKIPLVLLVLSGGKWDKPWMVEEDKKSSKSFNILDHWMDIEQHSQNCIKSWFRINLTQLLASSLANW